MQVDIGHELLILKQICSLSFIIIGMDNVIKLEEYLQQFHQFTECFIRVSFDDASPMHQFIYDVYIHNPESAEPDSKFQKAEYL